MNFKSEYKVNYLKPIVLMDRLKVITAKNPGPFTFKGTNTYIVGDSTLAIIDPGPKLNTHFTNLIDAIGNRNVSHIILTHSHNDHTELALKLAKIFEASIFINGHTNESKLDLFNKVSVSSSESDFKKYSKTCDKIKRLADGDIIESNEWNLEVLHTPGHSYDHICLAWLEEKVLFSGDHVMGWSSTMITPPSGNMTNFMHSLKLLLDRPEDIYFPGHGQPVQNARELVSMYLDHRHKRELQVLSVIPKQGINADEIVPIIYQGLSSSLYDSAALTILAHLIDLKVQKKVISSENISRETLFFKSQ